MGEMKKSMESFKQELKKLRDEVTQLKKQVEEEDEDDDDDEEEEEDEDDEDDDRP